MAEENSQSENNLIPLYGFLKGDCLGLLILAHGNETIGALINKLQQSARTRISPSEKATLYYNGNPIDASLRISETDIRPLDRFDVIQEKS